VTAHEQKRLAASPGCRLLDAPADELAARLPVVRGIVVRGIIVSVTLPEV
jgi:hypothetical protein